MMKTVYRTEDGKVFDTKEEALAHEIYIEADKNKVKPIPCFELNICVNGDVEVYRFEFSTERDKELFKKHCELQKCSNYYSKLSADSIPLLLHCHGDNGTWKHYTTLQAIEADLLDDITYLQDKLSILNKVKENISIGAADEQPSNASGSHV